MKKKPRYKNKNQMWSYVVVVVFETAKNCCKWTQHLPASFSFFLHCKHSQTPKQISKYLPVWFVLLLLLFLVLFIGLLFDVSLKLWEETTNTYLGLNIRVLWDPLARKNVSQVYANQLLGDERAEKERPAFRRSLESLKRNVLCFGRNCPNYLEK